MSQLETAIGHLREHRAISDDPEELTPMLYGSWYARDNDPVVVPEHFPCDLVQALRAADATASSWEDGWSADRVDRSGRVIARRGREVRMSDRCDYLAPGRPGLLPRPADDLRLAGRRDRVDADGSWWRTAGRGWRFTRSCPDLVRIYWNFELGYLPVLVHELTGVLAADRRPWMLKCAADTRVYARADAAVLYLSWKAVDDVASLVDAVAGDLSGYARRGAPPLALPIHPGVAVAVDPDGVYSFGWHRCRLIVDALHGVDLDEPDVAVDAIRSHMAANGIDVCRPHAARTDPLLPWER